MSKRQCEHSKGLTTSESENGNELRRGCIPLNEAAAAAMILNESAGCPMHSQMMKSFHIELHFSDFSRTQLTRKICDVALTVKSGEPSSKTTSPGGRSLLGGMWSWDGRNMGIEMGKGGRDWSGTPHMVINDVGNHLEYACKYCHVHPSLPEAHLRTKGEYGSRTRLLQ